MAAALRNLAVAAASSSTTTLHSSSCGVVQGDGCAASRSFSLSSACRRTDWSAQSTSLRRKLSESRKLDTCNKTLCGPFSGRRQKVVGRSGRRVMYGDTETYVLMEPGEDEQFVTAEELQEKLKTWLQEWPGKELPLDLAKFKSVEEAVQYLVNSVCELELGDGQGSIQWFEVRLD